MIEHDVKQNEAEWHALRTVLAVPTASSASMLVTSKGEPSTQVSTLAAQLAVAAYTGQPIKSFGGNKYTDHGHEMEPEARSWYAMAKPTRATREVGFITDDLKTCGCSPDLVVDDDGLAEFKCLPVKHIDALLYAHKNNAPPADYIPQCHYQLHVAERAWVDLVYYSDTMPTLVFRIERSAVFDAAIAKAIIACNAEKRRVLEILNTTQQVDMNYEWHA